jgi:hypothetical protein
MVEHQTAHAPPAVARLAQAGEDRIGLPRPEDLVTVKRGPSTGAEGQRFGLRDVVQQEGPVQHEAGFAIAGRDAAW